MNRKWSTLVTLLTIQHAAFVILTVWLAPTQLSFGALFLTWMSLPAFTAAIACNAARLHVIAAAANGVLAATILDYLFLKHGYYWQERPEIATTLAVVYLLLGAGVSTICGAFVDIISTTLESNPVSTPRNRLTIAARRGMTFSSLCVGASLPVLVVMLPLHTRPHLLAILLTYALSGISGGVLVASIVGVLYAVPQKPPSTESQNAA